MDVYLCLLVFSIGRFLDVVARKEMWRNGLDYRHGTGHGIGMFLSVHEGKATKPGWNKRENKCYIRAASKTFNNCH